MHFKVYDSDGELRGALTYAEDAAALVAVLGEGSYIKAFGRTVWSEGHEEQPAFESYDFVAEVVARRFLSPSRNSGGAKEPIHNDN